MCSSRGVKVGLETVGKMVGKNPFDREGNHSGHPPCQLRGDRGAGISGVAEDEVRENG